MKTTKKTSPRCGVQQKNSARKANYATVDREKLEVNPEKLDSAEDDMLAEEVNQVNPDMNSMTSRG